MDQPDLFLIAVNLTRRCNLACAHCYMDARTRARGGSAELTTVEAKDLLSQIAARTTDTMVVLTGGEPLLRHDLEELVAHGSRLGLSVVVGTNGVLLSASRAETLQAAGAMGVGISLDSLDPAAHDRFRGCPGSWEKTLAGMDTCRRRQLPFQVHFSVTERNAHEVPGMIDFARAVGAHGLNAFFLVCTGRGESMSDITPQRYEQVLQQLVEAQAGSPDLIVRARCAPHFKRVAYQRDPASPLTRAEGYEGGGCLAGIHYCRVTPEGAITACPYIPDAEGNIRERPFWDIWDRSDGFAQLRQPLLHGKCGACEYRKLCGGCRARPLALGGTLMDTDPWCDYAPAGGPVIEPLAATAEPALAWTPEAEQRLARVPGFLRKMVRKRAAEHALALGASTITREHLATLAARRFGDNFPGRPGAPPDVSRETPAAPAAPPMTWTPEAGRYLDAVPGFLRDGIRQVAEDVARNEGRLEVNMQLLGRLEEEDSGEPGLPWEAAAEQALTAQLAQRPTAARLFVRPRLRAAAEREARRRRATRVAVGDLEKVAATDLAAVDWEPEALARVESAPDFVRAGIKKAAEFNARREGLKRIGGADLTRFRNRAMLRAVRRMKGFGMTELEFGAFDIARQRVPRLRDNDQAAQRFAAIRDYVESHQAADGSGLGLLDRELIEKMKAELKK